MGAYYRRYLLEDVPGVCAIKTESGTVESVVEQHIEPQSLEVGAFLVLRLIKDNILFCLFVVAIGLLNPLDCPHHMRIDEEFEYREGVTLAEPVTGGRKSGSMVNCGLRKVQ